MLISFKYTVSWDIHESNQTNKTANRCGICWIGLYSTLVFIIYHLAKSKPDAYRPQFWPWQHGYTGAIQGVVIVNHCSVSLFGTNGLLGDIVIRWKSCSQLMRWMMHRWWCDGGGDRAWWVIERIFLRSPDKGFWACLGDLPPDMPRRPES